MNPAQTRKFIALVVIITPTVGFGVALFDFITSGFVLWKFALLALFYFFTLFGLEAGFHRLISHQAYNTPLRNFIVILGSMAAQGPPIFWAATHRQHHAFSDSKGDPHSPQPLGNGFLGGLKGFIHGHFGWLLQPDQVDWNRFALDLYKDRSLFKLNQQYAWWVGLGLLIPSGVGAIIEFSLSGNWIQGMWMGFIWGGLARIFLVHHAVWAVNSICHLHGTRQLNGKGLATNVFWLAIPTLGGSWHNNHHAFPYTADNQFKWYQFDGSGLVLKFLKLCGLVNQFKKPSPKMIEAQLK